MKSRASIMWEWQCAKWNTFPTILECDSLINEDKLETKDNCKFYIKNTTVCITDSDDLDKPNKLVEFIFDDKTAPTLDLEDESASIKCIG